MDHEGQADAPAAVKGQSGGVVAPEPQPLQRLLQAAPDLVDNLAVPGHRDPAVKEADPLDGGDRRLQCLGTVQEGIDEEKGSGLCSSPPAAADRAGLAGGRPAPPPAS